MHRVLMLATGLIAAIALVGYAQEGDELASEDEATVSPIPPKAEGLPHDVPPEHAVASVAKDRLRLLRFSFAQTQQYVLAKIEVDGETSEEWIMRTVPVGNVASTWVDLSTVRAYEDGQRLAAAQVAKRLAKPKHVLIATKKLDPFYLDVLKEGVIVLVMPSLPGAGQLLAVPDPAGGVPVMAPQMIFDNVPPQPDFPPVERPQLPQPIPIN